MIYLTRLNGQKVMVNIDLVEFIEETPDTVITLTTGKKFVVKESAKRITERIIKFRKSTNTVLKR
ncbi:Flagellar protein FlbD [Candidatus Syntrophocurvum alkaliphilum]|uniref:Flagellar protein FlbD n=1 Tax=Candidatus Syntrophocurvum alkaliphilum TaxID=2293317 RepID=A0A6I6D872_9FIRM|nr:flagellar FlbD family protein [Candidatus Syntrophocurvum alkaliphilum]QGT99173.1 Flagellar protein FlbD [Candidatus Syntrophocurvum alkaliphilum]